MVGSREVFWLHAVRMAFKVSGYTSGVVASFSIRQPITRASTAVSCGAAFSASPSGVGCAR